LHRLLPLLSLAFSPTYRAATRLDKGAAHPQHQRTKVPISGKVPEMGMRSVLIQWVFPELY